MADFFDAAKSPIANEGLHSVWELLYEVGSGDASDGTAVDADLAPELHGVYEEVEDALSIDALLVHVDVWCENTLLGCTIAPVVPADDIALPAEEEVKPVSIC